MRRVTPDIGDAFGLVEQALQEAFIPDFFRGLEERTPDRGVTRLHVKHAGLDIPDTTKTDPYNWTEYCVIT